MKNILKLILFNSLFFYSFSSYGQSTMQDYLDIEKIRIKQANVVDKEIDEFIKGNLSKYELTQNVIDEILLATSKENHEIGHEINEKELLLEYKRHELRRLYFFENPKNASYFEATTLPEVLRQQCANGGFDNGAVGYTFASNQIATNRECGVALPRTGIIPTVNDFTSSATVISSAVPGFLPNDPSLLAFGVTVPTLSPNGSTNCIKLNNNVPLAGNLDAGGRDVTTMTTQINITDPNLEYEFSLLLQASGHLGQQQEPIFRVRILNLAGEVINQRCIISAPNCNFLVAHSTANQNDDIFYTGWVCDNIDVSALVNAPTQNGVNAILEFTIADCGQGAHFGTVYIDNICNFTCPNPLFGVVRANPLNNNCPNFSNNEPYQICGDYTLPANSTLDPNGLTVSMSIDGLNFTPLVAPDATVVINNDGTFCFLLNTTLFATNPLGMYTFRITERYTQGCGIGSFSDSNTTLAVANFANCCQPTLTSSIPLTSMVREERSDWIKSTDFVTFGDGIRGNGVVYHAENFVELNPGFEAVLGSQFAAYPQGCTIPSNYVYRNSGNNVVSSDKKEEPVNLVKVSKSLTIYPNPSSSSVEFLMKDAKFNKISVISIEGKKVYENRFENKNTFQLDISNFANGLYIVSVVSDDGKLYTEKLIKN